MHETLLIKKAYEYFNARNIDAAISLMHPAVHWPNGWEGGYVNGHDAVRDYWTRQWKEIDPYVEPFSIRENEAGNFEVEVNQLVKDKSKNILFNGTVKHIYTIENGLIKNMEIEEMPA